MKKQPIQQPTRRGFTPNAVGVHGHRGFTLLIAIVVVGIILAISLSISNITLKEFILSGIARESAIALNAADAGIECALYWDRGSQGDKFDIGASGSITCMGQTRTAGGGVSGTAQNFEFEWGAPAVCTKIAVTKYYNASGSVNMGGGLSCPMGVECTRTEARGYNTGCSEPELTAPRTVERALRALY